MSFVARQGLRAARALPMAPLARQQARMLHVENVVDHALPTNVTNKPVLAAKVLAFTVTGFSLPFVLAWYQLSKAGAA